MFASAPQIPTVSALPSASSAPQKLLVQGGSLWFSDGSAWAYLGAGGSSDPLACVTPHCAIWQPPGNSNSVGSVIGMAVPSVTGTATARNVATTRLFTRLQRLGIVSASTAGSMANARNAAAQLTLGVSGTPDLGGFDALYAFGCSDAATVAGARQFVGMSSSVGVPTNVEPSTLINVIGIGHGAADTNLKIYYGGGVAQTPIDLGANFPANTLSVDAYVFRLTCEVGVNNAVSYTVTRLNTGHVASGTLTAATPGTQLPSNTTLLSSIQAWRTNNTTALAVGLDIIRHAYRGGPL